ncbi:helix-turn-helix transcriptional regulator [Vibrio sp. T187]|uniref:LuxR C-terminal-related transcriptional regulator n=1 Tax=Vibrio TaxID=662 RepID=UPI0010C99471|nr:MULTISPECIES: LuxR C-terminal-related transcriptional regulator [Vibrio]MBW3695473.1 helix-turn-helix transcriptional regulator [Vibrio sp. T187]
MNNNDKTFPITFVAQNTLQSTLLKESIEKNLSVSIRQLTFQQLINKFRFEGEAMSALIVLDFANMKEEDFATYFLLRDQHFQDVDEVLINCPPTSDYASFLKWKNLVGVFYSDDSLEMLVQGMKQVLEGEIWFSRQLAQEYIRFYRNRTPSGSSEKFSLLTKREQQIIKLLGEGASNNQIASQLFVSENTVKTHLHNVFKKINVRNRLQALLWAKENIGSEEFV